MVKERIAKGILIFFVVLLSLCLLALVGVSLWLRQNLPLDQDPLATGRNPQQTLPSVSTDTTPTETTGPYIPPCRFTAEDFAYEGDYLTCITEECLIGIDVSKYQEQIDWEQVAAAGIRFVMIRLGYRGYSGEGVLRPDEWAQRNYKGAKEAGLLVGAYFFSQAISVEEAVEEAHYALELTEGWELDLPIAYDWEFISEEARTANVDADTLTACAVAFCQEISDVGRRTMIYIPPWTGTIHLDQLTEYPKWLARYTDTLDYPYDFDMWQYTCYGKVPGIEGDVDLNIFFPYDKKG
jgi:GH25 family lysozyme M1 (1,4-beta-N-acetylmuramidase)